MFPAVSLTFLAAIFKWFLRTGVTSLPLLSFQVAQHVSVSLLLITFLQILDYTGELEYWSSTLNLLIPPPQSPGLSCLQRFPTLHQESGAHGSVTQSDGDKMEWVKNQEGLELELLRSSDKKEEGEGVFVRTFWTCLAPTTGCQQTLGNP